MVWRVCAEEEEERKIQGVGSTEGVVVMEGGMRKEMKEKKEMNRGCTRSYIVSTATTTTF